MSTPHAIPRGHHTDSLPTDAKNNTTQSTLTYYERSLLRKEGAARRIGNDSMKPLDHCNLCLTQITEDNAVACPSAHVFCCECAIADLLSQRAGIEAQKAELAAWERDDERKRAEAREAARARVVEDFEKGMGLAAARRRALGAAGAAGAVKNGESSAPELTATTPGPSAGKLEDDIDRIAREAEDAAAARILAEDSEARKAKIAAFWLPANAPEAPLGPLASVKLQTLCHVGGLAHPTSRKGLLPVIFSYPDAKRSKPSCPSCTKELSNATGAVLLSSRKVTDTDTGDAAAAATEPSAKKSKKNKKSKKDDGEAVCGHVVCKTCADTMVKPAKRCCVCEEPVEESGMLALGREGELWDLPGCSQLTFQVPVLRQQAAQASRRIRSCSGFSVAGSRDM